MKRAGVVLLVASIAAGTVAAANAAQRAGLNTPSDIIALPQFYSDYEHLDVHFVVGFDNRCVSDGYGGWNLQGCYDAADGDGTFDVRVYQTYPRRRFVHSERDFGVNRDASVDLFWTLDLGAPFCGSGPSYTRRYIAYLRLYSPIDSRVLARTSVTFGTKCG